MLAIFFTVRRGPNGRNEVAEAGPPDSVVIVVGEVGMTTWGLGVELCHFVGANRRGPASRFPGACCPAVMTFVAVSWLALADGEAGERVDDLAYAENV
jgi:hypothetical protein